MYGLLGEFVVTRRLLSDFWLGVLDDDKFLIQSLGGLMHGPFKEGPRPSLMESSCRQGGHHHCWRHCWTKRRSQIRHWRFHQSPWYRCVDNVDDGGLATSMVYETHQRLKHEPVKDPKSLVESRKGWMDRWERGVKANCLNWVPNVKRRKFSQGGILDWPFIMPQSDRQEH